MAEPVSQPATSASMAATGDYNSMLADMKASNLAAMQFQMAASAETIRHSTKSEGVKNQLDAAKSSIKNIN